MPIVDSPTTSAPKHAATGKYLTFTLGPETYGLPVLRVREIIRLTNITPVPQMPRHVRGVFNLRGKIIPVVDLHLLFGLAQSTPTERSCIVVVQVRAASDCEIQLGIIVDDVQEVAQISGNDIEATPQFSSDIRTDYLLGIAKLKGRVAILLDIDKALAKESSELVNAPAAP
jgi:purine-binding chemotaxis protein CheW